LFLPFRTRNQFPAEKVSRGRIGWFGEFVSNGVFSLSLGEKGDLLLNSVNGYYERVDASGKIIVPKPLVGLAYYGHTYHYDPSIGRLPFLVDGAPLEISPDFLLEAEPFLGFNPDGSFAIVGFVKEAEGQMDHQIKFILHRTPNRQMTGLFDIAPLISGPSLSSHVRCQVFQRPFQPALRTHGDQHQADLGRATHGRV
jgi:hypothetical protein